MFAIFLFDSKMNLIIYYRSFSPAVALSALRDTDITAIILFDTSDYVTKEHGSGSIQREIRGSPVASLC